MLKPFGHISVAHHYHWTLRPNGAPCLLVGACSCFLSSALASQINIVAVSIPAHQYICQKYKNSAAIPFVIRPVSWCVIAMGTIPFDGPVWLLMTLQLWVPQNRAPTQHKQVSHFWSWANTVLNKTCKVGVIIAVYFSFIASPSWLVPGRYTSPCSIVPALDSKLDLIEKWQKSAFQQHLHRPHV